MNKKLDFKKAPPATLAPEKMAQPASAAAFLSRGMAYYSRRIMDQAQQDLTRAVELEPGLFDAHYALGMVFKARGEKTLAEQSFRQVIKLLDGGSLENVVSAHMLRRLAMGEINAMTKGDWDLAKELFRKV